MRALCSNKQYVSYFIAFIALISPLSSEDPETTKVGSSAFTPKNFRETKMIYDLHSGMTGHERHFVAGVTVRFTSGNSRFAYPPGAWCTSGNC